MIASMMLYALLVSAVFSVLALVMERTAEAISRPRRHVWLLAMVLTLAYPTVRIWSAWISPTPVEIGSDATAFRDTAASTLRAPSPASSQLPKLVWPQLPTLNTPLLISWCLGSTAVFAFYAIAWIRLRRTARDWPRELLDGERVMVSENIGPAVLGFVTPQIVIPRWLLCAPPSNSIVLAHERQHIVARDTILLFVGLILVASTPWNLLLWWQLRRLRFAIEVDCDARVLCSGADARRYGEILLAVGQRAAYAPWAVVAVTARTCQLERRISIMLNGPYRYAHLLVAACMATAVSLIAIADEVPSPAPSNTAVNSTPTDFRSAAARHGANAQDPEHAGIWKNAIPPNGTAHGEFDNNDPVGLAAGAKIKADCSTNWIDPDSGKRYCFSTSTSLNFFLDQPRTYIERATKNWDRFRDANVHDRDRAASGDHE